MNAKVGCNNKDQEATLGHHSMGTRNENDELFTDFCVTDNLVIGDPFFRIKNSSKPPVSPDHIAINRRFRRSYICDVKVYWGADISCDHHLVIGRIRLKLRKSISTSPAAITSSILIALRFLKYCKSSRLSSPTDSRYWKKQ